MKVAIKISDIETELEKFLKTVKTDVETEAAAAKRFARQIMERGDREIENYTDDELLEFAEKFNKTLTPDDIKSLNNVLVKFINYLKTEIQK